MLLFTKEKVIQIKTKFFLRSVLNLLFFVAFVSSLYGRSAMDLLQKGIGTSSLSKKIEYFTKAISKDSNLVPAYRNRAKAYEELEQYTKAYEDYTRILSLQPDDVETYFLRGNVCEKMGAPEKAIKDYNASVFMNPFDKDTLSLGENINHIEKSSKRVGPSSGSKGNKKKPGREFPTISDEVSGRKKVVGQLAPQTEISSRPGLKKKNLKGKQLFLKGLSYKVAGQWDDAIKCLSGSLEIEPANSMALSALGEIFLFLGKYEDALEKYEKALFLDPHNALIFCRRGKVRKWLGDTDGAMKDYQRAIVEDPYLAEAHFNVAWMYYNQGSLDRSLEELNKAIKNNPNYASAYNTRAWVNEDLGNDAQARKDHAQYRKIMGLD